MICQDCGVEAQTRSVSFYQNIGVVIMRFTTSVHGSMCKSCIHKHFWQTTGITAVAGWWGMISLVLTPLILINNILRYTFCLGMTPVSPDAGIPELTRDAVEKLTPLTSEMFKHLNEGENLESVSTLYSARTGLTPGQVLLFLRGVIQAHSQH